LEIKDLYSKVKAYTGEMSQIKEMFSLYENSVSKRLLVFSSYRAVKFAVLELSDPDLCHMFFIRMGVVLRGEPYKNILCEYLSSLADIDFLECDEEEMRVYTMMLDLLINYGKCEINCTEPMIENSPLHIAVQLRQYQFVILLVKMGCYSFPINMHGLTALDLALFLAGKYSEDVSKKKKDISSSSNSEGEADEILASCRMKEIIYTRISEFLISVGAERNRYVE